MMFSKLSALCVTGAMLLTTGGLRAQDFRNSNWGHRPGYSASNYGGHYGSSVSQNRFRDDDCDFNNRNNGYSSAYRGGTYGSAWPGAQWGGGYSHTQPYRSTSYLPAYRTPSYSNSYGYSQPGYRSTSTYGSSHPWYR